MTTRNFSESVDVLEEESKSRARNTSSDLTDSPKSNNDDIRQSSSRNSPIKNHGHDNSPTKSRNRRKNDARRRSGSYKKNQAIHTEQSEKQSQIPKPSQSSSQQITNESQKQSKDDTNVIESNDSQSDHQHSHKNSGGISNRSGNTSDIRTNHSEGTKESKSNNKELREQIKLQNHQLQGLVDQLNQRTGKIKELETALLSATRAYSQLEKIFQQELSARTRLDKENESLNNIVSRLKQQISVHEKNKFNNDELIRVLNATLMERETEVSILKLKLTRMQTNPTSTVVLNSASSVSSMKQDPSQVFASSGRSNSEFDRNSYIRSSMVAEAASVRASTHQLRGNERDASVWATVPEELTPSKRPQLLERANHPMHGDYKFNPYGNMQSLTSNDASSPFTRDRRYKTLPRSMKSPSQEFTTATQKSEKRDDQLLEDTGKQNRRLDSVESNCQITNLDDSNSTNQSGSNRTPNSSNCNDSKQLSTFGEIGLPPASSNQDVIKFNSSFKPSDKNIYRNSSDSKKKSSDQLDNSYYATISRGDVSSKTDIQKRQPIQEDGPPSLPSRAPSTPVKFSNKMKKILDKFRRSDSSTSKTDLTEDQTEAPARNNFRRGGTRSTMVAAPSDIRAQMSPVRQAATFQTDKPFADWDTDMLADWLTMIGLSMYAAQCRRWVACGAQIMVATPGEVDKGLGITNHLHRKKLRLAISELNGDCDKITKAAAKLDYLWVARWLDDIGLPQHKEAFINARVDGRVLNYLTVEDLISMNVKSVLHHASIKCGLRVLRSIQFDLQLLKRRATAEEIDQMSTIHRQMNQQVANDPNSMDINQAFESSGQNDVALWTCHRMMEWLRLIDFAEFAPNLRGSGVHGGLLVFEDGFNIDTMCSLLSIPIGSTLLRRHLSTFFRNLIGQELVQRKRQYQDTSANQQLNPLAEIKTPKKSQWFTKLKGSKVGQDGLDDYICPMYPVEPQLLKSNIIKDEPVNQKEERRLSKISESINV